MSHGNAAQMWKNSSPPGVVVSNDSVRDLNSTPRCRSVSTIVTTSVIDRPSRSVEWVC